MFTIGDFARFGRVSGRMLRHYDAIGLLIPARTDPSTGYRWYDADQLRRLNRIVALKDLGFTLQQVQTLLDEEVGVEELRGMLRLRRGQLEAQLQADAARLTGVEARLRMIEEEGRMPTEEVILKDIPATRVAALSAVAASYDAPDIGPVLSPLYPQLFQRLDEAGLTMVGAPIAYYGPAPEVSTEAVTCHAGAPVSGQPVPGAELAVVDLPAIRTAATIVHHGAMEHVGGSLQTLGRWIQDHGYRPVGLHREIYLDAPMDDPSKWVTELQVAVEPA